MDSHASEDPCGVFEATEKRPPSSDLTTASGGPEEEDEDEDPVEVEEDAIPGPGGHEQGQPALVPDKLPGKSSSQQNQEEDLTEVENAMAEPDGNQEGEPALVFDKLPSKSSSQSPAQQEEQEEEEEVARPKKKGGQVLFNASHSDYEVVAEAAEERGWRVVKSEEKAAACNVHWIDDSAIGDCFRKVEPWMRVNHFPGMNNALARKTRLARNMARMMRVFPSEFRFVPPTWVIPDDFGDLEKRFGADSESKVFYIVKPDHLCQGKGIFLTTELERLRQASQESQKKNEATVVQRYITRPMLIDGLKFDLRLYFLVAGKRRADGHLDLRMFLFRDGLVRLCTTAYEAPTQETMNQKCMHLTNYAVNKNSKNFQQNDDKDNDGAGSKRSLRWFLSYIEENFGDKERRKLWLKLMGLCVKTVLAASSSLESEYDGAFPRDLTGGMMGCRCFEVLGIDVMLDAKRKPYLIEVNHLPSFTCDSPLDDDIKRRLVGQIMDLTCEGLSGKDRKNYEQLVRDRRNSGEGAVRHVAGTEEHKSLLDLPVYKDFERAFPPPEGAPKMAQQLEAIAARVREIFKPVHAVKRASKSDSLQDSGSCKPPLPPKNLAAAPPGHAKASSSEAVGSSRRNGASRSPPGRAGHSEGTQRLTAQKRSRSAPGPPRCALPPIARNTSPAGQHGSRGRSPVAGEREGATPSSRRAASAKCSARVFLQLKSAQIHF